MKNNENKTTSNGISFSGLLAIAFIVLKLTGVIDWKWVWILAPIWATVLIALVMVASIGAVAMWRRYKR